MCLVRNRRKEHMAPTDADVPATATDAQWEEARRLFDEQLARASVGRGQGAVAPAVPEGRLPNQRWDGAAGQWHKVQGAGLATCHLVWHDLCAGHEGGCGWLDVLRGPPAVANARQHPSGYRAIRPWKSRPVGCGSVPSYGMAMGKCCRLALSCSWHWTMWTGPRWTSTMRHWWLVVVQQVGVGAHRVANRAVVVQIAPWGLVIAPRGANSSSGRQPRIAPRGKNITPE